ncbi:hypothetical protein [Sulfoacidibacillus ferrooxidans]|uniref:Uncharacterized protein n=1 Tax=Sulfoacidibacillus ferrooxidans TaxID=2005001 RepID=A0A9X1V828_9BACL|nr:hypothetical protein [Sulfoacidibacillus ferrooxidans]MCI0182480.1 hypothetical protein [Sulfoacidibacillus ferrooxidans]
MSVTIRYTVVWDSEETSFTSLECIEDTKLHQSLQSHLFAFSQSIRALAVRSLIAKQTDQHTAESARISFY